jgi:hypothetical protein
VLRRRGCVIDGRHQQDFAARGRVPNALRLLLCLNRSRMRESRLLGGLSEQLRRRSLAMSRPLCARRRSPTLNRAPHVGVTTTMGAVPNLPPTNIAVLGPATTGLRPRGSARSLLASVVRAKTFPASGPGLPQFVSPVDVRTERRTVSQPPIRATRISDDWEAMRRALALRGLAAAEAGF